MTNKTLKQVLAHRYVHERERVEALTQLADTVDIYGMTLLHHVAMLSDKQEDIKLILDTVFNNLKINFSARDKNGNTPLHLCLKRITLSNEYSFEWDINRNNRIIFPRLIQEAVSRGFDFTTQDNEGRTILQLAAGFKSNRSFLIGSSYVQLLLTMVQNPGIDCISGEGMTALQYSIESQATDDVRLLVNRGANPFLYSQPDKSPLVCLNKHIRDYKQYIDGYYKQHGEDDVSCGHARVHIELYEDVVKKIQGRQLLHNNRFFSSQLTLGEEVTNASSIPSVGN